MKRRPPLTRWAFVSFVIWAAAAVFVIEFRLAVAWLLGWIG